VSGSRLLVALILPAAVAWITRQERYILSRGIPLTPQQLDDAGAAGVSKPTHVRLLRVTNVPALRSRTLRAVASKLGLFSPHTVGLTARYGIFIRDDFWNDRALLVHELVHTAQYERFWGIAPFLRDYLRECMVEGYPCGALEIEAASRTLEICG